MNEAFIIAGELILILQPLCYASLSRDRQCFDELFHDGRLSISVWVSGLCRRVQVFVAREKRLARGAEFHAYALPGFL